MKKQILAILMVIGISISLVSCNTTANTNGNSSSAAGSKATSSSAATASTSKLAIGESYGGGVIFYIFLPDDPGFVPYEQHGLIVAPEDVTKEYTDAFADHSIGDPTKQTVLFRWSTGRNIAENNTPEHGREKIETSYLLGQGLNNTNKILATFPVARFPNTAAAVARTYNGGGYTDWFLPSKDELSKLSLSKLSNKSINGDFYWSSSQSDDFYGVLLLFGSSYSRSNDKDFLARVIAVRAF